uniref:IST1-like protein n=1 Tax=Leersia perrieri TaxID=77586 RepID=A0A0D9X4X4_9ORYZ
MQVEHIIREENMMAAQEILELFCELIAVRLPIIETQKECPIDLKEAISSICFAAPRCADLPELMQVQMMFATKYGKEFVAAATELMPDCGVNRQIIELLSIRAPPVDAKMKLLKEIAEEHEIDWDPSATETEYLKPHEDLLNGPTYFNGSTVPLPKEKHEETLAASAAVPDEDYESDTGFESLDLPEVPKAAIRPPSDTPATPDIGTHVQGSQPSSHEFSNLQSSQPSSHEFSNIQSSQPAAHEFPNVQSSQPTAHEFPKLQSSQPALHEFSNPSDLEENPTANAAFMTQPKGSEHMSTFAQPSMPVSPNEKKHFVPFASPPPFVVPSQVEQNESIPSPSPSPPMKPTDPETIRTIDEVTPTPATTDYLFSRQPEQLHSTSTENIANIDLDDVLSAAQTAAETAERAASAARAAANLAQLRIADLKKNSKAYENYSDGVQKESHPQTAVTQKPVFDHQDSFSNDTQGYVPSHVPQRSPSLEDDPYFSYPNLFSSKP